MLGGLLKRIASLYLNARRYVNTGEYDASNTKTECLASVRVASQSHHLTLKVRVYITGSPLFLSPLTIKTITYHT